MIAGTITITGTMMGTTVVTTTITVMTTATITITAMITVMITVMITTAIIGTTIEVVCCLKVIGRTCLTATGLAPLVSTQLGDRGDSQQFSNSLPVFIRCRFLIVRSAVTAPNWTRTGFDSE